MIEADITGRRPTRTPETETAYSTRLRQLITRVANSLGTAVADITAAELNREIEARAHGLSAATLRQYRAAIRFGVETGQIARGPATRQSGTSRPGRRRGCNTSSLKAKHVEDRDLRRIDAALRQSRSRYARDLRAFLLANRLVGARVAEWRHARFIRRHPETDAPALLLRNAKATNDRAHGRTRTLHLQDLGDDAIKTIEVCATWLGAREGAGTFAAWQSGAAKLLQRLCRRLWPRRRRHVTLYSTRHHAAAHYKALYDKAEVAAVLGHAAMTTAGTHYARTARGTRCPRPGSRPRPLAADVARVRARAAALLPRRDPPGGGMTPRV
jgi:hypothetical protein